MDKKTLDALISTAKDAQKHSHAPYSGFHVGAAVLTSTNEILGGCNVESAAYPLGQCAEASAIGNMVTQGHKRITAIVIASPNDDFCFPCGGCRQKIVEFATDDVPVIMVTQQDKTHTTTIGDLMPHAFRASDLK